MTENNQKVGRYSKKSPSRGGARKNSGRKEGAATKKTREIADKESQNGITPLEVMLMTMREFVAKADALILNQDPEEAAPDMKRLQLLVEAASIAKDAAPYMHPRLAAIEHTGKDGKDLLQRSGVLLIPPTMSALEWEKSMANSKA